MPRGKPLAKAPFRAVSDPKKFASIERRIDDILRNDFEAIETGKFIRTAPCVFTEMKWLCDEIRGRNKKLAAKAAETVEEEAAEELEEAVA